MGRVRSGLRRGTVVSNRAQPSRCVAISNMHLMTRRPMRFHSKDLTFRTRWHRRFPDIQIWTGLFCWRNTGGISSPISSI